MLIQYGYNGYLSKVSNLSKPANEWVAGGMPITKMMNIERRHGEDKPVIKKALVELDGAPFKFFEAHRAQWAEETCFVYPGAIRSTDRPRFATLLPRHWLLSMQNKFKMMKAPQRIWGLFITDKGGEKIFHARAQIGPP
ncbi:MAG: hypothetical protein V8Q27_07905 [Eubacteriales bacterium]